MRIFTAEDAEDAENQSFALSVLSDLCGETTSFRKTRYGKERSMARLLKAGLLVGIVAVVYVAFTALWPSPAGAATGSGQGPSLESIGPLAFAPDGTLFAADNRAAMIFALEAEALKGNQPSGVAAVEAVDAKLAAMLGSDADSIVVTDLAVHPTTRNVFVAVNRSGVTSSTPAIFRIDGGGSIDPIALDTVRYSRVTLPNPPRSLMGRGARADTVTDMALIDNQLWVAGLSNEEFSSKLRAIPFPFATIDGGASVEIYHGNHGAFETRSPVYTFVPYTIDGEPHLIAGYLCTPLVKFTMASLRSGAKVRGTTIAELGNMNRPLDMITYAKDGREFVLMSNNSRGVMKIPADAFADAQAITEPVSAVRAGVRYETVKALIDVEQLDKLDGDRAVVVARRRDGARNLEVVPLP